MKSRIFEIVILTVIIFCRKNIMINRIVYFLVLVPFIIFSETFGQTSIQPNLFNYSDNNFPKTILENRNNFGISNTLLIESNEANISQLGNNNEAYITQVKALGGFGNIGEIIQSFGNNQAIISQNGSGNNNLIEQDGTNNSALVNVNGDYNNSVFMQKGLNNFISQDLEVSNKNYYFTQQGENNMIVQKENNINTKHYIISQKGNGMHMIITNAHY
ncbi:MAG: hypothetical protein M1480_04075 [Bacteroidetes bacterium]|nr:hypothetical protein [Bacteroidota bacterium]